MRINSASSNFCLILFLISCTCVSYACSAWGKLARVDENFFLTGSRSYGIFVTASFAWRFSMCVFLVHLVRASRLLVSFSARLKDLVCGLMEFVPLGVRLWSVWCIPSLVPGICPLGVTLLTTQSIPRVSCA